MIERGASGMRLMCWIALLAGCRFGAAVGTSRRAPEDSNETSFHAEGGGYKASGLGGFVVVGGRSGKTDTDSIHNFDSPWLIGDGRFRHPLVQITANSRAYAAAALGAGLCRNGLITAAHAELGVELRSGGSRSVDLALRYRPTYIVGHDAPIYAIEVAFAVGAFR
jgi:hypothetical protein